MNSLLSFLKHFAALKSVVVVLKCISKHFINTSTSGDQKPIFTLQDSVNIESSPGYRSCGSPSKTQSIKRKSCQRLTVHEAPSLFYNTGLPLQL